MNAILRICGVMACAASVAACATITRGTKQAYVIETDPPGAQVALSTGQTCVTPCALRLPRKHGFTAEITREGYEPVQATVASGISGGGAAGMAGNVLLGGLIGAGVDAASGAMNDLRPNPLRVAMVPVGSTPAESTVESTPAVLSWDAQPAASSADAAAQPAPAEAPAADAPAADAPVAAEPTAQPAAEPQRG